MNKRQSLPFFEHEKDSPDYHQKSDNVIPPETFFQIQNRKDRKNDEGNAFLDNFYHIDE